MERDPIPTIDQAIDAIVSSRKLSPRAQKWSLPNMVRDLDLACRADYYRQMKDPVAWLKHDRIAMATSQDEMGLLVVQLLLIEYDAIRELTQ